VTDSTNHSITWLNFRLRCHATYWCIYQNGQGYTILFFTNKRILDHCTWHLRRSV